MDSRHLYLNASNWPQLQLGQLLYFAPRQELLDRLGTNPEPHFWQQDYTAFAYIIIDRHTQTIRALRDHLGLEPLFYTITNQQFIFASNLADLIKALAITPAINTEQVHSAMLAACGVEQAYTDATIYHNLFRVEPGCHYTFKQQQLHKRRYWQAVTTNERISYPHPYTYIEHFSHLLHEGIKLQLGTHTRVAAEFSGGLDSSAVVSGLLDCNLTPSLFMQIAPAKSQIDDDLNLAQQVIDHYQLTDITWVTAANFDLDQVVQHLAPLFAGSPHYLFAIGANNVHQAVHQAQHQLLFSGFGGDECASGHAPLQICLRELLRQHDYQAAWHELGAYFQRQKRPLPPSWRRLLTLIRHNYPRLFNLIAELKDIASASFASPASNTATINSVREFELNLLLGPASTHLRNRLEDSALAAHALGFSYRYPLLYPPLLEYCLRLPLSFKRKNGINRLMLRSYLAKRIPASVYNKQQKSGSIMPATIAHLQANYQQGHYASLFAHNRYVEVAQAVRSKLQPSQFSCLLQDIFLYGLTHYLNTISMGKAGGTMSNHK